MSRHRHAEPYAAVVLRGGYVEAGDAGRRRLGPGDVVFHAAFEAHANAIGTQGAQVLNLPVTGASDAAFARIDDADEIARLAERDVVAASQALAALATPLKPTAGDWPDLLARDLASDPNLNLAEWADDHRLAPATVSRGFRAAFGVTPKRFRLESRARRAIAQLLLGGESLATIAADVGFADQPHLTRAVAALTGRPPAQLR